MKSNEIKRGSSDQFKITSLRCLSPSFLQLPPAPDLPAEPRHLGDCGRRRRDDPRRQHQRPLRANSRPRVFAASQPVSARWPGGGLAAGPIQEGSVEPHLTYYHLRLILDEICLATWLSG